MSAPITPGQVEAEISRLSVALEAQTEELAKRAEAAAEADAAYKKAHAQAFLAAEGPMDARKATADLECGDEYQERRVAEALLLAIQEQGRNLRAQLDSLRSINANLRSQT